MLKKSSMTLSFSASFDLDLYKSLQERFCSERMVHGSVVRELLTVGFLMCFLT